jgi:hypothetical protein
MPFRAQLFFVGFFALAWSFFPTATGFVGFGLLALIAVFATFLMIVADAMIGRAD